MFNPTSDLMLPMYWPAHLNAGEQGSKVGVRPPWSPPTMNEDSHESPFILQFERVERELTALIERSGLEEFLDADRSISARIEKVIDDAISSAYCGGVGEPRAHRFLQRVLYRINRLMLFWFDDLRRYVNDRSPFLNMVRAKIEAAWQSWEIRPLAIGERSPTDVVAALQERTTADVDAPPAPAGRYFRDHATLRSYHCLVAIASLDGLVEASQLSRTLGGVSHPGHAMLTRLFLEEYGGGRRERKHSTYFHSMMAALGMDASPEAYLGIVPWEVLAGINHSFLLSDRRRLFLRYIGGLLYTETSIPTGFRCYVASAQRLGLPPAAMTYWELHVKEDARHGPWMLNDVAIPLVHSYPNDAWEIILGYDQQKRMSDRAGEATARVAEGMA